MIYRTEQNRLQLLVTVAICIIIFTPHKGFASDEISLSTKIVNDYSNYYSQDRLFRIGIGFLAMGVMANTRIDGNIQDWYKDEIRSENTDDYSKTVKLFGEGKYLLPIAALASTAYYFDSDSEVGNWGLNSFRAYAVGLPAMWVMQNVTGASRPEESNNSSKWKPFNDTNGVSGHAFIGAVPFLTIARMSNNKFIKYSSYVASVLAAWSRVNDDDHFVSQAVLGWHMAYESVGAVFDTNDNKFSIFPVVGNDYYGIIISAKW